MIQRVQTMYLVLVKIFALLFIFLPLGKVSHDTGIFSFSIALIRVPEVFGEVMVNSWLRYGVIALAIIAMILSLIATLSYKNRKKQIKICHINTLAHILMITLTFFYVDNVIKEAFENDFSYGVAIVFPLLSLLLLLLAIRAIKKDENLVKAADRLR